MTLASLPRESKGYVTSIQITGPLRRRILDLGMVPGTPVHYVRSAPGGDPIAFRIRGAVIALRRRDAGGIKVHLIEQNPKI
ncbi:MAG: ferrous iron transport protein A [Syntrophomonadaceae bacterium]|nr:ferrous iron transport protein A [Syntrophomonadaceae bacterium]